MAETADDAKPKERPFIPKNIACPFHVGGMCVGSLCGRFVIGPNVCSDVAMVNTLQHVAGYLQDFHSDFRDLQSSIENVGSQLLEAISKVKR